jgi:hypothetical protein
MYNCTNDKDVLQKMTDPPPREMGRPMRLRTVTVKTCDKVESGHEPLGRTG